MGLPPIAANKQHTATNPTVLVEVPSPSTEDYDTGEKLEHYKQIASVSEIVLIACGERRVTLWQRTEAGWTSATHCEGSITLSSLGCSLPLDEIYFNPLAM